MEIVHTPVMKNEILSYLVPVSENPVMIDCTTGEGGHTQAFLDKYPFLTVFGFDRDSSIQAKAVERFRSYGNRFVPVNGWFDDELKKMESSSADMILFDLGISIFHYAQSKRGFSFRADEKLDMRLDENQKLDAATIVNEYREEELADLIYQYAEERYSRRIAHRIAEERSRERIESAARLADIISSAVPPQYRHGHIHPATRTFQALRIEVNKELDRITPALEEAVRVVKAHGRIAVVTFHSLEDRQVKWFFKKRAADKGDIAILTKHPLTASQEECSSNPPSRSAKLRIIERKGDANYENRK